MYGDDGTKSGRCVVYEMQRFVVIEFGVIENSHTSPLFEQRID